jgi:hypothetical protein
MKTPQYTKMQMLKAMELLIARKRMCFRNISINVIQHSNKPRKMVPIKQVLLSIREYLKQS